MAKVSVIIPVYNAEKYLPRCIDSLCAQAFEDCEFVFVDDGSIDTSASLIRQAAGSDARIVLVSQPNGGVSAARNTGLNHASSPYIAFVDADDRAAPRYVQALYELITAKGADLSVCGLESTEPKSLPDGIIELQADDEARVVEWFESYLAHNVYCKLYRRDVVEKFGLRFDTAYDYGEDFLFNLGYFARISRVAVTSEILYFYDTAVPGSLSKKFPFTRFLDVETQHAATEDYFSSLGFSSPGSRLYLDRLDFWNAYDAVHNVFANVSAISKAEAISEIGQILQFRYFRGHVRPASKPTLLMRFFAFRNAWLIYSLVCAYRRLHR